MHYDDGYIFDDADVDNVPVFSESRRFSLLDSHEKMLLRDYIRSCIREHREFSPAGFRQKMNWWKSANGR